MWKWPKRVGRAAVATRLGKPSIVGVSVFAEDFLLMRTAQYNRERDGNNNVTAIAKGLAARKQGRRSTRGELGRQVTVPGLTPRLRSFAKDALRMACRVI